MTEVAASATRAIVAGVLARRPAVVNCSATSTTPRRAWPTCRQPGQYLRRARRAAGQGVAMTWAYSPSYGKPLSFRRAWWR